MTGNYNTGPLNDLVVPLTRYNAFARVEHEVFDNFKAYAQFNYTSYQSGALLAPSPGANSPATGNTGFLVPVTNPFIPADLRAILASRTGNPRRRSCSTSGSAKSAAVVRGPTIPSPRCLSG